MAYLQQNHSRAFQGPSLKAHRQQPGLVRTLHARHYIPSPAHYCPLDIPAFPGWYKPGKAWSSWPDRGFPFLEKFILGTEEMEPGNLLKLDKGRTGMSIQCLSQFNQSHLSSGGWGYLALAMTWEGCQGLVHSLESLQAGDAYYALPRPTHVCSL